MSTSVFALRSTAAWRASSSSESSRWLQIGSMMTFLRLSPVVLSSLLMGAHCSRANLDLIALVVVLFPCVLFLKRPWVARLVQVVLLLGAMEWVRTLLVLVAERRDMGQSWGRLAAILGVVALLTLGSALVFSFSSRLRQRYGLE